MNCGKWMTITALGDVVILEMVGVIVSEDEAVVHLLAVEAL